MDGMSIEQMLSTGGISAGSIAIIFAIYKILKSFNHKKLRSNCCGKNLTVGVSVEHMTPEHSQADLSQEKKESPV